MHVPASYGSYIYGWPSKYDQVFWPLTVDQGIWFCEQSGFIAFIRDFDGLTDGERGAIKAYLEKHYQGPLDTRQKLALLEAVYVLREKPDDFRNKLVRVLARWYQDLGDHEKANQLRGQALAQMREALAGDLPEPTRLEYVYVSCNYDVLLGNTTAKDCMPKVKKAIEASTDKDPDGYAAYLGTLLDDTARITRGGTLDPLPRDKGG
ncbi:hypothetical protein ACQQ2N_07085 [Dokdonella sp. MW10]|uniref:hypothetical protein n=1 Tax=Dokdonella sp. MW10 TaxID=2992926 RepID=UPI003F7D427F